MPGAGADSQPLFGAVPFEDLVPLQRAQMEAVAKASHSFVEGLAAINREVMEFADQRARAMLDGSKAVPKDHA